MNFVVDGIYSIPGAGLGVKENGGEEEEEKRRGGEGENGLVLWPNPARTVLSVKCLVLSSGGDYSLLIYDIFGRKVSEVQHSLPRVREGQGGGWTMEVSSLPSGIYLLVLKDGQMVKASAKFVVAR